MDFAQLLSPTPHHSAPSCNAPLIKALSPATRSFYAGGTQVRWVPLRLRLRLPQGRCRSSGEGALFSPLQLRLRLPQGGRRSPGASLLPHQGPPDWCCGPARLRCRAGRG